MSSHIDFTTEKKPHAGWGLRRLADGREIPEIAFGSWQAQDRSTIPVEEQVGLALEKGFVHIDTAQVYRNEKEVGQAIKDFDGPKPWVTTKWSGLDGKGVWESLHDSLGKLGLTSVDLYLIHHPRLTNGDPPTAWREFERAKKEGHVKSIGVSNFSIADLESLRLAGLSTPVVNQILLHPGVYDTEKKALLDYHEAHGIVTEAYSPLKPLTDPTYHDGPIDKALALIAKARGDSKAAILLSWSRAKGSVVLTASSKEDRLIDFIAAGEVELTKAEILSIDLAGKAEFGLLAKLKKRAVPIVLAGALVAGVKWYFA